MIAVMEYQRLPIGLDEEIWRLYRDAMEPTRADAIQRHLLHRTEYDAIDWNKRITKLVAYDTGNHQPVGFTAITNHLDEYDLIEPKYFEERWPDAYKRKAIWYVLFTVTEAGSSPLAYPSMVREIVTKVRDCKGIGVVDWSTARRNRRMDRASYLLIKREAPELFTDGQPTDQQSFVVYEFAWPD